MSETLDALQPIGVTITVPWVPPYWNEANELVKVYYIMPVVNYFYMLDFPQGSHGAN